MIKSALIEICSIAFVFLSTSSLKLYGLVLSLPVLLSMKHSACYEFGKPVVSIAKEEIFVWKLIYTGKQEVSKLQHDTIYYSDGNNNPIKRKHYNVIVIFTEGTSLAVLSPELTPNIWGMMHNSLYYTGFFNHTAATFRGLRGQNASFYQMTGGYTEKNMGIGQISHKEILNKMKSGKSITTIPEILRENGYDTFFQLPCSINDNLSLMMDTMDFNHLFTMEDVDANERTKWPVPPGMLVKWFTNNDLTDGDSYKLLWKNIQALHQKDKPFYYGIYTVGTHVGLDSPEFRYRDGQNSYRNKFYNMDRQFGEFLHRFNDSPISDDTILIFTADHATYPEQKFVDTFGIKSKYFVDQVPLIIYKKNSTGELHLDADGKNSLDIAPTIMDILGVQKATTTFLGCSLFDTVCHSDFDHLSALGLEYYTTYGNVVTPANLSKDQQSIIESIQSYGG
ncbi:LTA synthase family protein [Komagataeibacter xylinus]|uniref:LTA synthase family protein n=1 Tax=Komagataeibacter xylinus TaxID=28448 RepID=UPI0013EC6546|nr:sulfatase-like hydrolase/transferase [Komagataeibacter xylinus]